MLIHSGHCRHGLYVFRRQIVKLVICEEILLVLRYFVCVVRFGSPHSLLDNRKVNGNYLNTEFLHQLALVPYDREERSRACSYLTYAHALKVFNHTGNAHKAFKARFKFIRLNAAAGQMGKWDMISLKLSRNPEKPALRIGRSHAVLIIFIVKRRPQKHRLTESLCYVRRRFLVAEVAVYNNNGVNLFRLKALNNILRRFIIVNKVGAAEPLAVGKGYIFAFKVFFYVVNKSVTALLCRNPG